MLFSQYFIERVINNKQDTSFILWLWKGGLNSDGQQFHQYQQNDQSPLIWTQKGYGV